MFTQNMTWLGTARTAIVDTVGVMAMKWRHSVLPGAPLARAMAQYTARFHVGRAVAAAIVVAAAMLTNQAAHAYSCETLKPVLTVKGFNANSVMASTSAIPLEQGWTRATITISVAKPGHEDWIRVVLGKPQIRAGYQGPNAKGTLTRINASTYEYAAPTEPFWQVHPDEVAKIPVMAKIGSKLCSVSAKPIVLRSVFEGLRVFAPEAAKYWSMYNYVNIKYAGVLATTGGAFTNVTIPFSPTVRCNTPTGFEEVDACTTGTDVVFGTNVFGTENIAASTIGHELVHTTQFVPFRECPSYNWEFNHRRATGLAYDESAMTHLRQMRTDYGCW